MSVSRRFEIASVVTLLVLGLLVQLHFLRHYPQPPLFGDPGAYHLVGLELRAAVSRAAAGEPLDEVLDSVRPYLYLVGIGSVYGGIEAVRGAVRGLYDRAGDGGLGSGARSHRWLRPLPFFRLALALINVVGMLGVYVLARQLSGSHAGGLVALSAAVVYPSFSVQIGRLFPEPVFAAMFVWSAVCYHRAVTRMSVPYMVVSGLLLSAGFFFRAQLMNYFPILVGLWLVMSAPLWFRAVSARRLVLALALSIAPSFVSWKIATRAAGNDFSKIESFGFFHFPEQHLYPYGFWMLLDADGWMGAYQLRQDPFYAKMVEVAESDPDLMRSRGKQLWFATSYVWSRLDESVLVVLDNIYRTHDRPANNYQWDYPMSTERQTSYQRILIVCALAGASVVVAQKLALAGVLFVPLSLALLFGMSTPQPRYGQPSMLIVIALAGTFIALVGRNMRNVRGGRRLVLLALGAGLGLALLGTVTFNAFPESARVARALATLSMIAVPFIVGWLLVRQRRWIFVAAWVGLATVVTAHTIRDITWHEEEIELGRETLAVEQEIVLSAEALAELRRASQPLVVIDLHTDAGTLDGAVVEVNGVALEAGLSPTMVDMGESTRSGGRNPNRYRQWWAVPLPRDALPPRAPATLRLRFDANPDAPPLRVFADRFADQERVYEGPSFGDTPHTSAPKLEHSGDYRLPIRAPLESAATTSIVVDADGERRTLTAVLRMRVITLRSNEAFYAWETPPLSPDGATAIQFHAYAHGQGDAELVVNGETVVNFPLGSNSDFDVERGGFRLCYRAEPARGDNAYGGYVLELPRLERGGPLALTVRYRSGMSRAARFFSVDSRREVDDVLAARCEVDPAMGIVHGLGRVLDATMNSYPRDTGRWSVDRVF